MKLTDQVYGAISVDEPVLVELLQTPAMQRICGVSQWGIPDEFYQRSGFSRFDHSVGVMHLLGLVGASVEEQIAGLLHDVSHTAFSHVVDWVIGEGGNEGYQDEQHERIISESQEMVRVLEKYGYSVSEIVKYEKFTLLEKDAPDICADRVDYVFRESSTSDVQACLTGLINHHGEMVFSTQTTALLFADTFLHRQVSHWGSFNASIRYRLFANILREALDKKLIVFEDFWQDDAFVIAKLVDSHDPSVLEKLRVLREEDLYAFPLSGDVIQKKFRFVDPKFFLDGQLKRLSEVDADYSSRLAFCREQAAAGIPVPQVW